MKVFGFGPLISIPESQVFLKLKTCIASVNIRPVVPGHSLVIPIRPGLQRVVQMNEEEVRDMWRAAQVISAALEEHYKCEATTFVVQDGQDAGQTVQHVHLHVLPRKKGDFEDNNQVYRELEKKGRVDDLNLRIRSPEEMQVEASLFRKLIGHRLLLERVEEFVKEEMHGNDPSHDMDHVYRVRNVALDIALQEKKKTGRDINMLAVELGALLHDVKDHKYSGDRLLGGRIVKELLNDYCLDDELISLVVFIVENVSFTKEKEGMLYASTKISTEIPIELACVQDADRLDAIGAVGIARCFSYGAVKNRKFGNSILHFHEKLVHLKGMMKTQSGSEYAVKRHAHLLDFLKNFEEEVGINQKNQ
jgi:diadenosine tetraphosphate (Ap4A) HIT family hydrolase/HD superfamily phosphodiesterase